MYEAFTTLSTKGRERGEKRKSDVKLSEIKECLKQPKNIFIHYNARALGTKLYKQSNLKNVKYSAKKYGYSPY